MEVVALIGHALFYVSSGKKKKKKKSGQILEH
jgi:hypothetical protein